MSEQWFPIPGFEHLGEVSNLGRVRSRFGKIRKTVVGNTGYERVGLKKVDGKNTNYVLLHRLVALAFCPGYQEGYTVNHIDGNKLNNVAANLEWVNHKNNIRHAYRMGLRKGTHRKPIIPREDRATLMADYEKGITYRELAERYGVHQSSMRVFLRGRARETVIYETA
jgi:HNH endonuclease/NUMOD4 motif